MLWYVCFKRQGEKSTNFLRVMALKKNTSRVTAQDVAKLAGVSQSTVSRVLSGKSADLISEEVSQRIYSAAAKLSYTPDPIARALRSKRTNLLGLIVRDIADPFFSKFIAHLGIEARDLGYQIILGHAYSDPRQALQMSSVFDARHCDGVLILGDLRDDEAALQTMVQQSPAVVALCRGQMPTGAATVNTDNVAGARALLDKLFDWGHRRIAFIDGGWLGDIQERREAFLAYLLERNLPMFAGQVQSEVNSIEGGYRAMHQILKLSPRPTAVFAADDLMAFGALRAAHEAGLQVPRDLSVIGFDDLDIAQFSFPALTTARQPIDAMSRHALRLARALIDGSAILPEELHIQLAPEVILRESAGPPPAES
jgi:LacI family transcriptional regulator